MEAHEAQPHLAQSEGWPATAHGEPTGIQQTTRWRRILAIGGVLFVLITLLRLLTPATSDATTTLYAIPIVLVAIELGTWAGVLVAALATMLFTIWANTLAEAPSSLLAHGSRSALFFLIAIVAGHTASTLRARSEWSRELASLRMRVAIGEQRALELIASGASQNAVLDLIIEMIEREAPGMRGSVLLVPDGKYVKHASAPNLPAAYLEAIDGAPIGPSEGSCGTAMWRDERVIVSDIATDPLWDGYRDFALQLGLRACWSTPIHSRTDEVIGSFAMYYDQPREPSPSDLELADLASHLTGIVIDNERMVTLLRRSDQRYREIVETANEGIWMVDAEGITTFVNPQVSEMLGYQEQEILGVNFHRFMNEPSRRVSTHEFERRRKGISGRHDACLIRSDGTKLWALVSACPIFGADGEFAGSLAMLTDITDRVNAERHLRHLALHDPVTELPNREVLMSLLKQALQRQARSGAVVAVLFVDLDNFKLINDTLGHQVGDEVLAAVASRLSDTLQDSDTIARLSSDEFVIVSDVLEPDLDASALAERVGTAFEQPFVAAGGEHFITASIGIAVARGSGTKAEDLLREADAAMCRAKHRGGDGHVLFDEEMRGRAVARRRIVSALRGASARGELKLAYQPIFSLENHRPVAAEALLRWNSPTLGSLPPMEFIPIAEQSGLIDEIGEWVLEHGATEAAAWPYADEVPDSVALAVNLSVHQLAGGHLVADVERILESTGFPPERLWLEVTETVLIESTRATRTLEAVRNLGPRIILDDFGTGYSSMSYLLELPIDAIKIDRSFVRALELQSPAAEIISAVVTMGRGLGKPVIAEGVETERELNIVRDLGCDLAQGFLLSVPLAEQDIADGLKRQLKSSPGSG